MRIIIFNLHSKTSNLFYSFPSHSLLYSLDTDHPLPFPPSSLFPSSTTVPVLSSHSSVPPRTRLPTSTHRHATNGRSLTDNTHPDDSRFNHHPTSIRERRAPTQHSEHKQHTPTPPLRPRTTRTPIRSRLEYPSMASSSSNVVGVHYRVGKKIGEGSFGVIFEGTNLLNNQQVAIKFVR